MRGANELDGERSNRHDVARLDAMQQHVTEDAVLIQLALGQAEREVRGINRNVNSFQHVGQRPDMILMPVGENDRGNVLLVLFENFEIRNANIDAVDALFGKAHARIEHQHLVPKPQQSTVHPKLADTSEGYDFEDVSHYLWLLDSLDGIRKYIMLL